MGEGDWSALISLRTLCFLRRDNRVLLLHRRNPPNAGYWNGVGGKLEPGEDPFTACVREVREETSLTIRDPKLRVLLVATVRSTGDLWIIFVFTADAPEAAPIPSEEGDLAWVEVSQLAMLPILPDLPLLLRHLGGVAVTVIRMELETEDAGSVSRVEVLGPGK